MLSLIPQTAILSDCYNDGDDALHLRLALQAPLQSPALPGQFFMLSLPGIGEAAFTFTSLPDADGCFTALVRKVGQLTCALGRLPAGSVVGVRGPLGQPWPALQGQSVLVVAGGCGLAPLAAWLSQRIDSGQGANTALLYSSRNESGRILARERQAWQQAALPMLQALDKPGQDFHTAFAERITAALVMLPRPADAVLVCGPEAMMLLSGSLLEEYGLPAERIWLSMERRMHCGIGLCGHCYIGSSLICHEGPTLHLARVRELLAQQPATSPAWTHC